MEINMSDLHLSMIEMASSIMSEYEIIEINNALNDQLKLIRKSNVRKIKSILKVGDKVTLNVQENDELLNHVGTVEKVNRTKALVKFDHEIRPYDVPLNMINVMESVKA
jgi:hypothetical protein|tara:strand:+ start:240 stop:566 length:327 start_codon:yes stop_codon:yes gene_type:complete